MRSTPGWFTLREPLLVGTDDTGELRLSGMKLLLGAFPSIVAVHGLVVDGGAGTLEIECDRMLVRFAGQDRPLDDIDAKPKLRVFVALTNLLGFVEDAPKEPSP